MNLCSDGHDEVCFEGRYCPVCEYKGHLEETQKEIDSIKSDLEAEKNYSEKLETENANLQGEIDILSKEVEGRG